MAQKINYEQIDGFASGSDANGEWTKFPDGTLICRGTITVAGPNTNSGSLIWYGGRTTWTFPAAFISTPSTSGNFSSGAGDMWLSSASPSTTSAEFALYGGRSRSGNNYTCFVTAVGRWK